MRCLYQKRENNDSVFIKQKQNNLFSASEIRHLSKKRECIEEQVMGENEWRMEGRKYGTAVYTTAVILVMANYPCIRSLPGRG